MRGLLRMFLLEWERFELQCLVERMEIDDCA